MSSGLKIHSFLSNDRKEKQPTMCHCRVTQWPHPSPFFVALLDMFKGRPALQTGGTGRGRAWADPDALPSDEHDQLRSFGEESPPQEAAPRVAHSQPRQRRPGATAASSSLARPGPLLRPPVRTHVQVRSWESRRVWQPRFTPVLQENKTATGNQTPGCRCAGPPPRQCACGSRARGGFRGCSLWATPTAPTSLRVPGLPFLVPSCHCEKY